MRMQHAARGARRAAEIGVSPGGWGSDEEVREGMIAET